MAGTRVVIDADDVLHWNPPPSMVTVTALLQAIRERFGADVDVRVVATWVPTPERAALRDEAARAGAQVVSVPPRHRGSSVFSATGIPLAVIAMEAIPDRVERLVLATLDQDFRWVVKALKRAGVWTVQLSPPERTPVRLSLAADERIDMTELSYVAEGLIRPGVAVTASHALRYQFARATREIAVIDPYVGAGTIRLLAWVPETVTAIVVGSKVQDDACAEARTLRDSGRNIRIVRVPRSVMPHDRWFRVDDVWWHSGASLKDLGQRFSRIAKVDDAERSEHDAMLEQLMQSGSDAV